MPYPPTSLDDATKKRLAKAALDALRHSGARSIMTLLQGIDPPAFVAVGSAPDIAQLARAHKQLAGNHALVESLAEQASQIEGDAFVAFPWNRLTPGEKDHFLRMTRLLVTLVANIAADVGDDGHAAGADIRARFGV